MILTGAQPAYWPWLGLIERISSADVFIWMDSVEHSRNSFENRNQIKTKNGALWLTVPVLHDSSALIKDIQIDNSRNWQKKHYESIRQAYSKTPYFTQYEPFLSDLYSRTWTNLSDLNLHILKWILEELKIDTKIIKMSDGNYQGAKSELILDMCLQLGASRFIFGVHGKDYVDEERFAAAYIAVTYQEFIHPEYVQPHGNFLPYMAVLDIMCMKGKDSLNVIRGTK